MPIPVACPCGAKFAAPDKLAGKRVKCPKCSEPLAIPAAAGDAPATSPNPPSSPTKTPAQKAATTAKTSPPGGAKTAATSPPPTAAKSAKSSPPQPKAGGIDDLFDEIGLVGSKTGVKCPKCGGDMAAEAVICVGCGFNTKTGKQMATQSDSAAQAKREEIYRKQREMADKTARKAGAYGGGSNGGESYGDKTGLSWVREQGSFGEVWSTTKEVLNSPTAAFLDLPPTGGTGLALTFPAFAQLWVAGIWFFISTALIIFNIMVKNPELAPLLPLEIGIRLAIIGISFVLNLIFLPLYGAMIAGLAHLLMMAGGSKLGFGATFRVVMYTMGAVIAICVIPCAAIFVPIIWPIVLGFALTAHHQVNAGMGFGGSFLGLIVATPLFIVAIFLVYVVIIGLVVAAIMASGGLNNLPPPGTLTPFLFVLR